MNNGRRPRVLHVGKFYPPYKGGMETHIQDLCRSLSPFADVSVLVSNSGTKTVHDSDGHIPVARVGSWTNIASAPISPGMVRMLRKRPADIVHLHCPNPTAVLSFMASGHPGKLVITHHSDIVRQKILRYAYEPLLHRVASRADAIVCFSPNYIESSPILSRFRDKCHVIPHGINPQKFSTVDPQSVEQIRERYGDRIVLGVGRLVYYKGFEYLIRAMADTNATLLIVGTGPLRNQLQQLSRDCGAGDRVHLLGEVDDVLPFFHAARVFALPSVARSEAFGIAQLEAMACGAPVVNTRLDSGVPFVSLDNVSGRTVAPCDVDALKLAITSILDDADLHTRYSAGARQRVQQLFTVDAMAEKTLHLYEKVLGTVPVSLETPELAAI